MYRSRSSRIASISSANSSGGIGVDPSTGLPANAVCSDGYVTGSDGNSYHYYAYIDVQATTYVAGGITAYGLPADENVLGVGLDENDRPFINFGTKVYVKGDYGDFGVRIASDYGPMWGEKIDVCLYTSNPKFATFGWRPMRVYFLG